MQLCTFRKYILSTIMCKQTVEKQKGNSINPKRAPSSLISVSCHTFCLSEHCPSQTEDFHHQTSRCPPGFLHLTDGRHRPHRHPHLAGRALTRCSALHQSDHFPPGLSACWHLTGSPTVRTGCRWRCVDCVAHPHCRLQTAPKRRGRRKGIRLCSGHSLCCRVPSPCTCTSTQSCNYRHERWLGVISTGYTAS